MVTINEHRFSFGRSLDADEYNFKRQRALARGKLLTNLVVCGAAIIVCFPVGQTWLKNTQVGKWLQQPPVKTVAQSSTKNSIPTSTPKRGDPIPGTRFHVTSPWGDRSDRKDKLPKGASLWHSGGDANTPSGTPVYLIGVPGEIIKVRCWWDRKGGGNVASFRSPKLGISFDYLHLKTGSCKSGKHKVGSKIAQTGATGIGAAHFHLQQRNSWGNKVPPQMTYLEKALTGRI